MDNTTIIKSIPYGGIAEIGRRLNISAATIGNVLHNRINHSKEPEILQVCADVIREHKERKQQAQKAINEAIAK